MEKKKQNKYTFEPDYAVPPGETLRENLNYLGMTQKDLADRTGLTVQSINRILSGDQPITYETANKLELVTNIPAKFWNNLEANYQEQLAKIKERQQLESDIKWLKKIPVIELEKRNIIEKNPDKITTLRNVLKFFGVCSVNDWRTVWENPKVAARRSDCFESCPESASVWLRLGEIQAQKIECKPYGKKKFNEAVLKIRKLTTLEPKEFIREMIQLCSESGVALALVPEIKKVPWSGATKWLNPNKAMILLNLRGKTEDLFWFAFFHEAGHVLKDSKKDLYINDRNSKDPREKAADEFASNLLVSQKYKSKVASLRSHNELTAIANELEICPGIVAGQFQHMTKKFKLFNKHKRKFIWAE